MFNRRCRQLPPRSLATGITSGRPLPFGDWQRTTPSGAQRTLAKGRFWFASSALTPAGCRKTAGGVVACRARASSKALRIAMDSTRWRPSALSLRHSGRSVKRVSAGRSSAQAKPAFMTFLFGERFPVLDFLQGEGATCASRQCRPAFPVLLHVRRRVFQTLKSSRNTPTASTGTPATMVIIDVRQGRRHL